MAKARPAEGILRDGHVEVQASPSADKLRKMHVGTQGDSLSINLVEAAWAVSQGRLVVSPGAPPAAELLAAGDVGLVDTFLAYADLRERGLVARLDGAMLEAWDRGRAPPDTPALRLRAASEDGRVAAEDLAGWAAQGVLAAVVDADGAVTHYRLSLVQPEGEVPAGRLGPLRGFPLADRVVLGGAEAEGLDSEHIGSVTALGRILSPPESSDLRRRGALVEALEEQPRREGARYAVYRALRDCGVVVRSGLKFGMELRGYRGDPTSGHAEWLVQCAEPGEALPWMELARGTRLAHGVRKTFLVGVASDPVRFVSLTWFKP